MSYVVGLVCGDRNWTSIQKIYDVLKHDHKKRPFDFIVEGGANGADACGRVAAKKLGIQPVECEPLWDFYGPKAGPIRNRKQLRVAMALAGSRKNLTVYAFHPDLKHSKGTRDMIKRAKAKHVKVKEIA